MPTTKQRATARVWLLSTAIGLSLVIVALAVANYSAQQNLVRHIEQDPLVLASQERLTRWAIEVHVAGLEQELLQLAKTADLKDAIVTGNRTELRDQLEPPLNRLRKGPLNISRLTLYTPAGIAHLRAHAPDSYGENVLSHRPLLAETVRTRRILKGLEVEDGRPYLWAATPIYRDGRVIGILEIGSTFAPVNRAIKAVAGGDVAVLVGRDQLQVVESSAPQVFSRVTPLLRKQEVAPARQVLVLDEKTYAITLLPLRDFSGKEVGCLAIHSDASAVAEILQRSNAISFVISLLGFLLAAGLLTALTLRLDKLHGDLNARHEEAKQSRDVCQPIS